MVSEWDSAPWRFRPGSAGKKKIGEKEPEEGEAIAARGRSLVLPRLCHVILTCLEGEEWCFRCGKVGHVSSDQASLWQEVELVPQAQQEGNWDAYLSALEALRGVRPLHGQLPPPPGKEASVPSSRGTATPVSSVRGRGRPPLQEGDFHLLQPLPLEGDYLQLLPPPPEGDRLLLSPLPPEGDLFVAPTSTTREAEATSRG
ncbi:UNVERIFIED_CONTAM: hypothetical protein FKN15_011094 [Acipenser sinensis]